MSWSEFFHMGGYGFYVWGVYIAACVILIGNVLISFRQSKNVQRALRDFYRYGRDQS